MNELFKLGAEMAKPLIDKAVWLISFVLGGILTAIGYPKEVLVFIAYLIAIDLLSKWFSIVKVCYGDFTWKNYWKAWAEKKLTSRQLKNGLGVKAIVYLPILYVAQKASILPEIIGGQYASQLFYSLMIVIEGKSIMENFRDAGYTQANSFLKIFNQKEKALCEDSGESGCIPTSPSAKEEKPVSNTETIKGDG